MTVLLADGKGGFAPARGSPVPTAERPYYLALGDVNGDGRPDLVVAHDDDTRLTVLVGDGKGKFAPAPGPRVELGARAFGVVVADVEKDGKPDVVAAAGESVRVLSGDGRGAFRAAPGSPFAAGKGCWRLALADLNGDGKLDVAATGLESDSVTVLLGK
ncbi:MAG TPA: VCBS repeat-containing protein [Fimbriiglobus sp.]|nr:VCBS repeat-containing protein [Fimbriiglobus sp.]